jgi:adenosylmethionine-8-amino-7-oxononanoate aminotransferase
VQRIIRERDLVANVRAMGAWLKEALLERLGNHPHVGDIRGRGLFWAIEFVADRGSRAVFDPALRVNERVKRAVLAEGAAIYPMGGTVDGRHGDHVIVAPPYIATEGDIAEIVDRVGRGVEAALDEVRRG